MQFDDLINIELHAKGRQSMREIGLSVRVCVRVCVQLYNHRQVNCSPCMRVWQLYLVPAS